MAGDDDKRVKGFEDSFSFGPSDHPEVKPLPFRIMAVGDFRGTGHDNRKPVTIDAHDFDDVMKSLQVRAFFEVENKLGGSDKTIEIDVQLESIKDYEPQNLAAKVPGLGAVNEFVRGAKGLADGSIKPAEFKRDLSEFQKVPCLRDPLEAVLDKIGGAPASGGEGAAEPAAESKKDAADDAINHIFNMVESKKSSGGSAVDDVAAEAGRGGQKGIDVSSGLASAEKVRDEQLKLVMDHPVMRGLEKRWRGLHLLCKRGKGAQIEVFDCAAENAFDAWQDGPYQPEYSGATEAPLGMVVLDVEIENSPAAMEMIQSFGEAAGNIQAPVVFSLGDSFFGESMGALAKRDHPGGLLDESQFDKWRSLRDKDESRWLVAAMNPVALRAPYNKRKHGYEESAPLTGAPAWIVAATVAQAMQRTGWPASHTGSADGEVEQLPTWEHEDGAEYPLETTFSDRALKELTKRGFTPLICQPNNDSAWVILAPTVHQPSKAEEEGKLGTLAYQLLAARIGELVVGSKSRLVIQGDMQGSAENYGKFLGGLLADTGPGAGVDISSEGTTLILKLRTGRDLLGGVDMQLGVNLA